MTHVAVSASFADLLDLDAPAAHVANGFAFTEGPLWHPLDAYLLFSDMPGDVRRRWDPKRGVAEVRNPSNKWNGITYDAGLYLIVCEHATSSLVRERPDGRREVLASHFEGKELNSPNDVCVRSDGSIYFTDPWYGRLPCFGVERPRELGFQGVLSGDAQRRAGASRRARPVRSAERPVLFARRENALCQRHCEGPDPRLPRRRRRLAFGRRFLRLRPPVRDGAWRSRRDEVRRPRKHVGARRRAVFGSTRRTVRSSARFESPRSSPISPGEARASARCSLPRQARCTRSRPRSALGANPTWRGCRRAR